ncbi:hypothetical protein [Haloprofundus sp. MHR1]|uniref:hypothetical protein n=1 Tax=Haloprofundus sp. MHR1 TaxID=2572921 RepID=UPI0010BF1CE7|nr:hypothetical protein [Haloprofundus sp. MHR1]QCJ47244.1 hypothetical protein FCF25_09000 [Haloprofundus sp. MHR1]
MSSSGDEPRLSSSLTYIRESDRLGGFDDSVVGSAGGLVLAVFGGIIAVSEAAFNLVASLFDAFTEGGTAFISAFTTDPANYISQSFVVGGNSFATSAFAELGPFLPWVAAVVATGVVFIVTEYLDRRNSDVPGLGINIPFVDNDSDGEEE